LTTQEIRLTEDPKEPGYAPGMMNAILRAFFYDAAKKT
jgi:hypothetical protein